MGRLKKTTRTVLNIIELHVPAILFSTVFVMFIVMIIYRYVLHKAVFEINELCQVLYVSSALLGASYSGRTDSHVVFPLLYDRLPAKVQKALRMISNVITVVLLTVMWYPCLKNAIWMHRKKTEVLDIPFSFLYGLWMVFMTLSICYCIYYLVKDCKTPAVKKGTVHEVMEEIKEETL